MTTNLLLAGDIGGTNARFAVVNPDRTGYQNEVTLQCVDFVTPVDAIRHYLASINAPDPDVICLAAAGPIVDDAIKFTNNQWHLKLNELKEAFNPISSQLLNDFEANAHALPYLGAEHCTPLGNLRSPDLGDGDFTVGVIGAGTGLGAAGLVAKGGLRATLVTEAGHVGFAPETAVQGKIREVLLQDLKRVSDERLVSGMGIENIYHALCKINSKALDTLDAAEIFIRCRSGSDEVAAQAVDVFFEVFGQAAGNLALSMGAFDGIFLVGGIVQKHRDLLLKSNFRTGFEAKGRHSSLMERIPCMLVSHPDPGLLGASAVARQIAVAGSPR